MNNKEDNHISILTKISKWKNSNIIKIPLKYMKHLHLKNNQSVKMYVKNDKLIINPINKQPHNIYELFKGYHNNGKRDHELDWGKAKGRELK